MGINVKTWSTNCKDELEEVYQKTITDEPELEQINFINRTFDDDKALLDTTEKIRD